jgi:O-methyltransferase
MTNYKEDFLSETVSLYKKQLALIRSFKLSNNEAGISHQHILSYSTYSPWIDDEAFINTYEIIKGSTLVDIYRCYELWNFIKKNSLIEGDVLEVGVWRGGTGCLIAKAAELYANAKVYLADTFTGVVKASAEDTNYKGGEHADTNIDLVMDLINQLQLTNVEILKGIFPDEVNLNNVGTNLKIKLCHIDVDTYTSAKDIFDYVWPYMVKGGAVIFDDYGFWGCEGITKLCNDIKLHDSSFIHNINGHAIFIKL